jgi:Putative phage serine protease XkdF
VIIYSQMEIRKSHWESRNGLVSLSVPIMKVNQEKRLVSGFATLNNLDRQGDIVLSEASKAAFAAWPGNVREMHANIAAGKVVSFREQMYYDTETEKFYEGVFVEVYVSKGARDTWEKVLDGTLTGFSIGGRILEEESFFDADLGRLVNVIKAYELSELSLVDVPANQLANVFSIAKADNGDVKVSGIAVDVETVDVYWNSIEKVAVFGSTEEPGYEYIGWIESTMTDSEKSIAIAELIKNTAKPAVEKKEGVETNMANEVEETVETVEAVSEIVEEAVTEEAPVSEDTAEEVTAEADAEVEAADDTVIEAVEEETPEAAVEIDWEAEFKSLKETVGELAGSLAGIAKSVEGLSGITKSLTETVEKNAATTDEAIKEVASHVKGVEKSIVSKKAADRDVETRKVEKQDIWADRFTAHKLN